MVITLTYINLAFSSYGSYYFEEKLNIIKLDYINIIILKSIIINILIWGEDNITLKLNDSPIINWASLRGIEDNITLKPLAWFYYKLCRLRGIEDNITLKLLLSL